MTGGYVHIASVLVEEISTWRLVMQQTAKNFLTRVHQAMMKRRDHPEAYDVYLPTKMYIDLFTYCDHGALPHIWNDSGRVTFMGFTVVDAGPELQHPYLARRSPRLPDDVDHNPGTGEDHQENL